MNFLKKLSLIIISISIISSFTLSYDISVYADDDRPGSLFYNRLQEQKKENGDNNDSSTSRSNNTSWFSLGSDRNTSSSNSDRSSQNGNNSRSIAPVPNGSTNVSITGYSQRRTSRCGLAIQEDCSVTVNYRVTTSLQNESVRVELFANCPNRSRRIGSRTLRFRDTRSYEGKVRFSPRDPGFCIVTARSYFRNGERGQSSDLQSIAVKEREQTRRSSRSRRRSSRYATVDRPFCNIKEAFGDRDCRNSRSERVPLPRSRTNENSIFINFGPDRDDARFDGYRQETGLPFGYRDDGLSFGWNTNNSKYTVKRGSKYSPDNRFDTLAHFDWKESSRFWEIELPNGRYDVEVGVGDPFYAPTDRFDTDTYHSIDAEGRAVERCSPSERRHWCRGSRRVNVEDGRLTLSNGRRSNNTKINYVIITPI